MNGTFTAISTATLLAVGSSSALAASNAGLPALGAQVDAGDLVFAYEAADGQSSIVWDLSNGDDDLTWGSILSSNGFTISNTLVSNFVASNPGGRWNILGLTNTKQSGTGASLKYEQGGFGLTVNGAPNPDAPNGNTGLELEALMNNSAAWIGAANAGGLPDNGALLATAADHWQFSAGGTHGAIIADQNATGLLGDTLAYWTILIDSTVTRGFSPSGANASGRAPIFTQVTNAQGQPMGFTLAADGSLSYAAIQPIPLPPAVWLLGSALAGLGALRRREH